ncbi:MAG: hypothetical protein ACOCYT_02130 [Chloroflexota bacterium]
MIEKLDNILIHIYRRPIGLIIFTLVATILGFGLHQFAPEIDQSRVFYLPLLPFSWVGLILAVLGLTVSLVFYAQHHSPGRSLLVIGVVGALVIGAMSFSVGDSFDDITHHDSARIGSSVYHLGSVQAISDEGFIVNSYSVYRCDTFGIFCETQQRGIVPSISRGGQFQNSAVLRVDEGELRVLDGGNAAVLYSYTPG